MYGYPVNGAFGGMRQQQPQQSYQPRGWGGWGGNRLASNFAQHFGQQQQPYQPGGGMQSFQGQQNAMNGQGYQMPQQGPQGGSHNVPLGYSPQQSVNGMNGGSYQPGNGMQSFGQQQNAQSGGGLAAAQGYSNGSSGNGTASYTSSRPSSAPQLGSAATMGGGAPQNYMNSNQQMGGGMQAARAQSFAVSDERQKIMKRIEAIELRLSKAKK